jgi:hypothetical protein
MLRWITGNFGQTGLYEEEMCFHSTIARKAGFTSHRLSAVGLAAAFAACAMAVPRAQAQNLVLNPGFEETSTDGGNTSPDWTLTASGDTTYVNGASTAHSGDWAVEFAATDATTASQGTLSQAVTTVPSTYYTVTFFLANEGGPHNTFLATFGGQTVLSLTDADAFGYTQYTATIKATSDSSVLAFAAQQDPADFLLDDVSVEAGPLPLAGGGLMSFGVAAAGFAARRIRASGGRTR